MQFEQQFEDFGTRYLKAYKEILGKDFAKYPVEETRIHAEQLRTLRHQIDEKYGKREPRLELEPS